MAALSFELLAFIFGLLGNIISFLVFLAPLPTFYQIWRKNSSDGFQSIPYSVALFSAALLLYYAFLKTNAYMIVSINGIGCVIESIYLLLYVLYASKKSRAFTIGLVLIFNVGGIAVIMLFSLFLVEGPDRVTLVGWICAAINIAVFAAPLSIMESGFSSGIDSCSGSYDGSDYTHRFCHLYPCQRELKQDEKKKLNATYIISVARKLGCSIFLLLEDIMEVNQKMMLMLTASILLWSLQRQAESSPSPSITTPDLSPAPSINGDMCTLDESPAPSINGDASSTPAVDIVIVDVIMYLF